LAHYVFILIYWYLLEPRSNSARLYVLRILTTSITGLRITITNVWKINKIYKIVVITIIIRLNDIFSRSDKCNIAVHAVLFRTTIITTLGVKYVSYMRVPVSSLAGSYHSFHRMLVDTTIRIRNKNQSDII